jgi:hypothetical protein
MTGTVLEEGLRGRRRLACSTARRALHARLRRSAAKRATRDIVSRAIDARSARVATPLGGV